MSHCLTDEELAHLAIQASPDAETVRLQGHILECPGCQHLLAEWRENVAFEHSLKGAMSGAASDDGLVKQFLDEDDRKLRLAEMIPGYEFLHELHRGTQGVVYHAIQSETGRQVAIKFLREGVHASRATRKRFEREVEIVARLQHPNIIRVSESGVSHFGHHYYVMDHVQGLPLNRYVWDSGLSVEAVLRLFEAVCDAVNYAHQHGVIHRDLKPSNILVDGEGVPRVLDFGLARPTLRAQETWASMTGEVVGTLPYMSPEQAEGTHEEIDIRTDVYSLGVMLYQVLTGEYPYPVTGPIAEVLNHIAETEPVPPRRRWSRQGGGVRTSERSGGKHECPIDEQVETIILRALAKDPARRYPNVSALMEDIRRHLDGQPIEARRDAGLHVLRKSLARYKVAVAAAVTGTVLIAMFAVTSWGMYQNAVHERQRAEAERRRAVEVQGRLADVLMELGDRALERGDDEDARAQYQAALALNQHLAASWLDNLGYQARLADNHCRLGDAAWYRGDLDQAAEHYRAFTNQMSHLAQAVPDHKGFQHQLAVSQERLARVLLKQGDAAGAEKLLRQALASRERLAEDPRANASMISALAEILLTAPFADLRDSAKGLKMAQRAADLTQGKDPAVLAILALAYDQTHHPELAQRTREQTLSLVPETRVELRNRIRQMADMDGRDAFLLDRFLHHAGGPE